MASQSSSLKRGSLALIGLLFAIVAFVASNMLVDRKATGLRADFTQEKLFTLSTGTRNMLSRIEEPVTLRLYVSDRLIREIPSYGVYAGRVRELLEEYRAAANGKLRLQVIDPQPFSDEEDRAVAMGLQGVPVNQAGEQVYFGLAGSNSADKDAVIPFLQPERERFLEYDLTKMIFELVTTKKTLSLDNLLSDDSTFFGDLFAHVVQYQGVMYLEDGLHRAVRAALHQRPILHARVLVLA